MFLKIAVLAIVAAFCALTIRKTVPELSLLLTLAAGVVLFALGLSAITQVVSFAQELSSYAGISSTLLSPLLKVLGIAILSKIATDACKDAGSQSLAGYVELAGNALALVVSIPLLKSMIEMVSAI